jgi:coenzyme Q-binding protein COQ10
VPGHEECRDLPFRAEDMFALVADVARYPEFLPWTAAARIRSRRPIVGGEEIEADLVISFKVFRERFGSRVRLLPEGDGGAGWARIETEYIDGPFRHLRSVWQFEPTGPASCRVHFAVAFEFRNPVLAKVIGLVFHEAMTRVVRAFETRAKALYGGR